MIFLQWVYILCRLKMAIKGQKVPVKYFDLFLSAGLILIDHFLFLWGDHLNGLHEAVGHDGDADEEVEQDEGVEDAAANSLSNCKIGVW